MFRKFYLDLNRGAKRDRNTIDVTRTTYLDRLENHEDNWEASEREGLPPLSLVQSPPRFDDLPNLSETDSEDEEEQV